MAAMDVEINIPEDKKYGSLLTPDAKLYRKYFEEMIKLMGVQVVYYEPKDDKNYTLHGEQWKEHFKDPVVIGCIFDEYPDQKTMKKMGWVAELQEGASFIHVPYDLSGIQVGALFAIPSGLDHSKGRLFRVTSMSNGMIYPSSISCEIVPEYIDTTPISKVDSASTTHTYLKQNDPNVF